MATNGLQQRLEALRPEIRARRAEIEQARRMPRDLIETLRATGVFSLAVPADLGGRQAAPADIVRAIETVASADGSTGWCTMIAIANAGVSGFLGEAGAREIFTRPDTLVAGLAGPAGTAVRVDGGVRVSGRWPFASGITHCDWFWGGCVVLEDGQPKMTPMGPEIIHACIPMTSVEVHDTWFVSGLNGTGSNDASVTDVFVPEQRLFKLLDPTGHRPDPLYQLPALGWFVSLVAAVSVGIARAALDELIELAQTKAPTMSQAVLADRPAVQLELARAEAALGAARAFLYATVDDVWQTVTQGREPTLAQRARNRLACNHAAETAASVARTAHMLAGGRSIYATSSLQRHMRDAEAATHHFTLSAHVWEDGGRVLLGRAPVTPVI